MSKELPKGQTFYIIDGSIGVGKTTLGISIEGYLKNQGVKAIFLQEYSNPFLLDAYINDMPKYSFTYQLTMLIKRLQIYHEAAQLTENGYLVFVDRSLEGDISFFELQRENGNISESEAEIYYKTLKADYPLNASERIKPKNIFLQCSNSNALVRIQERARGAEHNYNDVYLTRLSKSFDKHIKPDITVVWDNEQKVVDKKLDDQTIASFLQQIGLQVGLQLPSK